MNPTNLQSQISNIPIDVINKNGNKEEKSLVAFINPVRKDNSFNGRKYYFTPNGLRQKTTIGQFIYNVLKFIKLEKFAKWLTGGDLQAVAKSLQNRIHAINTSPSKFPLEQKQQLINAVTSVLVSVLKTTNAHTNSKAPKHSELVKIVSSFETNLAIQPINPTKSSGPTPVTNLNNPTSHATPTHLSLQIDERSDSEDEPEDLSLFNKIQHPSIRTHGATIEEIPSSDSDEDEKHDDASLNDNADQPPQQDDVFKVPPTPAAKTTASASDTLTVSNTAHLAALTSPLGATVYHTAEDESEELFDEDLSLSYNQPPQNAQTNSFLDGSTTGFHAASSHSPLTFILSSDEKFSEEKKLPEIDGQQYSEEKSEEKLESTYQPFDTAVSETKADQDTALAPHFSSSQSISTIINATDEPLASTAAGPATITTTYTFKTQEELIQSPIPDKLLENLDNVTCKVTTPKKTPSKLSESSAARSSYDKSTDSDEEKEVELNLDMLYNELSPDAVVTFHFQSPTQSVVAKLPVSALQTPDSTYHTPNKGDDISSDESEASDAESTQKSEEHKNTQTPQKNPGTIKTVGTPRGTIEAVLNSAKRLTRSQMKTQLTSSKTNATASSGQKEKLSFSKPQTATPPTSSSNRAGTPIPATAAPGAKKTSSLGQAQRVEQQKSTTTPATSKKSHISQPAGRVVANTSRKTVAAADSKKGNTTTGKNFSTKKQPK